MFVEDGATHHCVPTDPRTVHQHGIRNLGPFVDAHVRPQNGAIHLATGDDASGVDDGVLSFSANDEFCPGRLGLVRQQRPVAVVEVELRIHGDQVHVGLMVGIDRTDVAPIVEVLVSCSGHHVVLEVVDLRLSLGREPRDDVTAHVMLGRRVLRIGPERLHQRVPRKDVIAHRCERLIRRVRQPRRVGGFLQEIFDAFVLAGINDAESTGLAAGYTDARDRTAESGIDVSIHHLLDVHPVDVVRAEHDDIVGIGITDQVE